VSPVRPAAAVGARAQLARLLALVPYLQSRTDVSLTQAARDLGVTPEQIRKDLAVLWMCGLPGLTPDKMIDVDMEAIEEDPEGVVRIDNADYLARPVRLGSSEASALIVALRALRETNPTVGHDAIDRALAKLEDAAATGTRAPAVALHLPEREGLEHVETLQEAISSNRQARLDYYVPSRDESTSRVVDPLELLTRDGHDYLDAWCHAAGGRRLFRLDRVLAVEVVDEAREDHELAPRDLSGALFEPGPDDLEALLRIHPWAGWVVDYYPVEQVTELDDGILEVRLRVRDAQWLLRLALRLTPLVEVVEPVEVRREAERSARDTLDLYTRTTGGVQDDGVR
jgi:proteasome accessory factor C